MKRLTAAFIFALLAFTARAQAETVNCTAITSLPAVITVQGVYCFTGNLSTAMTVGNAIDIQTNNVVLDLNGFKLGGLAAGPGTGASGIFAFTRQNITIKNGTVRGFKYGIWLEDLSPYTTSQGHIIEDIRADQNTYFGMYIWGTGNVIRNNQVVATGGSTGTIHALGIEAAGPGVRVLNNDVTEVAAQENGTAIGINVSNASNSVVAGNRVGNLTAPIGINKYGILLQGGSDYLVSDNRLTGMQTGIHFDGGATGTYMNNLVRSASTPYFGGTPAGTTNFP